MRSMVRRSGLCDRSMPFSARFRHLTGPRSPGRRRCEVGDLQQSPLNCSVRGAPSSASSRQVTLDAQRRTAGSRLVACATYACRIDRSKALRSSESAAVSGLSWTSPAVFSSGVPLIPISAVSFIFVLGSLLSPATFSANGRQIELGSGRHGTIFELERPHRPTETRRPPNCQDGLAVMRVCRWRWFACGRRHDGPSRS